MNKRQEKLNKEEFKNLRKFNLMISFMLIVLISSIGQFYINIFMSGETKFKIPERTIFIKDTSKKDPKAWKYRVEDFKDLNKTEWAKSSETEKYRYFQLMELYEAKKTFKKLIDVGSDFELELVGKHIISPKNYINFMKKNKPFFKENIYFYKSDIISFEKNYGKTIYEKPEELKKRGLKIYTNSQFRATVNFSKLITFKHGLSSVTNSDFFIDFIIEYDSDLKITKIKYENNKEMFKIIKDLNFFNFIEKDNFKSLFSTQAKDRLNVKKLLFEKIYNFKKLGVEYKNNRAEGFIIINNKRYKIIIKNERIINLIMVDKK